MTDQVIYINEDNLVTWDRVKLASAGTYVNSGTFTWQLKDSDDAVVGSGSLTYAGGGTGRWRGVIDKTDVDDLTVDAPYYLEVTGADGAGAEGFRRLEVVAQYHGSTP